MPAPRRFGRSRFTLGLLILASLTILTLNYRDTGPVKSARSAFGTVFSPFEGVGNAIASPFGNAWKGITSYDDLEDENAELRRENDELRNREVEDRTAREELDELRRLEGLSVDDIETVVAEVTGDGLTSFDTTFEISRGSGDGVAKGMVVMTESGLVGRVEEVQGGSALVRTIADPDYPGLGVRLVQHRDAGIAHPGSDGRLVISEGIRSDTDVAIGDDVETSGLGGGAYPPGIAVGTVAEVRPTDDRTEQEVTIDPAADLDGLRYVIVLLCTSDCG